jgi:hypothetical protein
VADIRLGVSGGGTFVVPPGSEMPTDDRNETSLSYRIKVRRLDRIQHQEKLLTIQGRISEERYIWDYTAGEFIEGIEKGGFVSGDSRPV